jgi:hypothetical protein
MILGVPDASLVFFFFLRGDASLVCALTFDYENDATYLGPKMFDRMTYMVIPIKNRNDEQ